MSQTLLAGWAVTEETLQAYGRRLGNMALLNPHQNVKIGNKAFAEKRLIFADSPLLLTQEIAEFDEWGPAQIEQRRAKLAEAAPKIWAI